MKLNMELYLKVDFLGTGWVYKRPITGNGTQTYGRSRLLAILNGKMRMCGYLTYWRTTADDDGGRWGRRRRVTTTAAVVKYPFCHILNSRIITNTKHRHLPYILLYKLKNVEQILALKTRGRFIRVSSFGQQLFQGCLCTPMADSCHEM